MVVDGRREGAEASVPKVLLVNTLPSNPGQSPRMRSRSCAAVGCDVHVARGMLMCRRHWFMLLPSMRDAVWATYLDGAGLFSDGYRQAVDEAVEYLAGREAILRRVVRRVRVWTGPGDYTLARAAYGSGAWLECGHVVSAAEPGKEREAVECPWCIR